MKSENAVLAAVVVVASVLIALLLAVKSFHDGSDLGAGWVTLLLLVFGAALGVNKLKKDGDPPDPSPAPSASEPTGGSDEKPES